MNYCIPYMPPREYKDYINEFVMLYGGKIDEYEKILTKHEDAYLIIKIIDGVHFDDYDVKFLAALYDKYKRIILEITEEVFNSFKPLKIPYFFTAKVKDLDTLAHYVNCGVSQVRIASPLIFSIKDIADWLHSKSIKIRVIPHVADGEGDGLKTFFIRPEDARLYEPFVDTFEFISDMHCSIYAEDKTWFGKLNEIIVGLDSDADNRDLSYLFSHVRLGCGKRCLIGNKCTICTNFEELSKALAEKKIILKERPDTHDKD